MQWRHDKVDEWESLVQEVVDWFLSQPEEILVLWEPLLRMAKDSRASCFRYVGKPKQLNHWTNESLEKNLSDILGNF